MMAPTRPTELYQRRVRLARQPAAAAEARSQVRAAIRDWNAAVDVDIAVLLTSDLVTSAITHGDGETLALAMRCSGDRLRVDVYDQSRFRPGDAADTDAGRLLVLVTALSAEWGSFCTPAGKAMYFTLALGRDLPSDGDRAGAADQTWGRRTVITPSGSPPPLRTYLGKTPTSER
jgi:hypothetical protein